MKPVATTFASMLIILLLISCAEKSVFVLLPGPDGRTGKILVSNAKGEQVLDGPKQATAIASAADAPTVPFQMSEDKITEHFGDALSALPLSPVHFILYFKSGTTELTDDSRKMLDEVISTAIFRRSTDMSVVGHTDRVGSREANYGLGLERTGMVRDILVSKGIDKKFIDVSSHGEDNPLVKTDDDVPESRNRRVEIDVR